ncbi:hypothetical protein IC620_05150 [Hazenella sp. IB182357]|uniref:Uncharacterized protein n=1 Tax=Polycladospora coralii TaxID=2771432 RepID=A0A926RTY9_9BACL|nr:hypothetical protein [Polycladospora coralii]MBD1371744.1 hypothetical protein [Polycladospora coralii]MBS7529211.1 hypothetical protein [Polycladospora coralii]
MELRFIDLNHMKRYQALKASPYSRNDIEYNSAYYLLTLLSRPVEKYVSRYGTEFEALIKDSMYWDAQERAIVNLANSLFSGVMDHKTDIHDIFKYLRDPYHRAAINVIKYRYHIQD